MSSSPHRTRLSLTIQRGRIQEFMLRAAYHYGTSFWTARKYHETNLAGDKVAFIDPSRYSYQGPLVEMDLNTGAVDTLVADSSINSVRYDESTGDLFYYSVGHYGKDQSVIVPPSYYRFSKVTRTSSLVLERGVLPYDYQIVNGFDVSSDGKRLLFRTQSKRRPGISIVVEHEIGTSNFDTLNIVFDAQNSSDEFWTQYSNNDSLILFSITMRWGTGAGESTVGIYDRYTKKTTPISLSPTNERPFSAPYPRWSPDDKAICYGGCEIPVNTLDYVGPFLVYIKPLEW
jgi:hypothetical protein